MKLQASHPPNPYFLWWGILEVNWYSAKRAGVKRICPKKVMAHKWFMHDTHLGRAFLFLDILAEYTLLSITVMVAPCLWYVVGMKLVNQTSDVPMSSFVKPLCARPLWQILKVGIEIFKRD